MNQVTEEMENYITKIIKKNIDKKADEIQQKFEEKLIRAYLRQMIFSYKPTNKKQLNEYLESAIESKNKIVLKENILRNVARNCYDLSRSLNLKGEEKERYEYAFNEMIEIFKKRNAVKHIQTKEDTILDLTTLEEYSDQLIRIVQDAYKKMTPEQQKEFEPMQKYFEEVNKVLLGINKENDKKLIDHITKLNDSLNKMLNNLQQEANQNIKKAAAIEAAGKKFFKK